MAGAIAELIQVLNSKDDGERMTMQEAGVLNDLQNRIIKGFAIRGSVATGLTWVASRKLNIPSGLAASRKLNILSVLVASRKLNSLSGSASRKLNNFLRAYLAGGAGFIAGIWGVQESINSSVNDILEMEGSRLQYELRKIVIAKYGNNPQRMQHFSKHFFKEEVLNDSAPGNPKTVYRQRNLYEEDQQTANKNTYGVSDAHKGGMYRDYRQQRNEDPDSLRLNKPSVGVRPVRINPALVNMAMAGFGDPLEVLFGYSAAEESSPRPDDSSTSTKAQSRTQKRAHRRHRLRHRYRESLSMEEEPRFTAMKKQEI